MTPRVDGTTISLKFAGMIAIIVVATGRQSYVPAEYWSFGALAGLTWLYLTTAIGRLRREHSTVGEDSLAPISTATWVTIARGFLIALVAGYAGTSIATGGALWGPGALYAVAVLGDRADGALARRRAEVSALGAKLDVTTDAVGLFVAPLVGVRWERLPPWYLVLAFAYPAFRFALRLRLALGWPVFPERLKQDPRARFFAGVQMTVISAALFPVLPRAFTWAAATLAMIPTLALFAREWRLVTGSAADGGARAQRLDA